MKKKRRLLFALYLWGFISLTVLIITRSEYLMTHLTIMGEPYGNLYKNCKVTYFKIAQPPTKEPPPSWFNKTPHDSCDIILLGDSHMRTWPNHWWFPVELQMRLNRPVYHMKVMRIPFLYLNRSGIKWVDKRRLCVLESAEARLYDRYHQMPDLKPVEPEPINQIMFGSSKQQPLLTRVRNRWFVDTELNYSFFLKNNVFLQKLIEFYYTSRFKYFGKISPLTPVYSLDPPFLFELQQVVKNYPSSYFYFHDDRMIAQMADNIKAISDSLSSMYNLELIFMPIPNSMTIHHDLVTDQEYDMYLPRLCEAVKERGVHVIELYDLFAAQDEFLYHPSDTHWNEAGASLGFEEMTRAIEELLPTVDESVEQKSPHFEYPITETTLQRSE